MPTVMCKNCGRPWMDTKYTRCPHCGTADGNTDSAVPAEAPAAPSRSTPFAPSSGESVAPMTRAQADRIIKLLEHRTRRRVDVVEPAVGASQILQVLAAIVLILGALGVIGAVVAAINVGFWQGLLLGVSVAAVTALNYATLTVCYVIAGYIANRS